MEIIKSEFQSYGFTYKKLSNPSQTQKGDYEPIINMIKQVDPQMDFVFENDSKGQIHIHGIVKLKKHFHRKKLIVQDFSMKLEELYDIIGWQSYMHKQDFGGPLHRESATQEQSPNIPRVKKNIMNTKRLIKGVELVRARAAAYADMLPQIC